MGPIKSVTVQSALVKISPVNGRREQELSLHPGNGSQCKNLSQLHSSVAGGGVCLTYFVGRISVFERISVLQGGGAA